MQRPLFENTNITPIVFGCNVFGWTIDEALSFRMLDHLVDRGLNCIDTADTYARWIGKPGISESIIGRWLKQSGKREKLVIATKVGMEMAPDRKGLSKKHILASVDESLQRLQIDCIDLYQAHQDDPATPLDESLEAFDSLVKAGKVKAVGASNYSGARLREAQGIAKSKNYAVFQTLQPHYNLYERQDFETDLAAVSKEQGLAVIPYFSLAAGFLTGKYRSEADFSKSARGGGMKKYLNDRGLRILGALDTVAANTHATPAQIALAWLLSRPAVTAPIVSATTTEQLDALIAALDVKLDAEALKLLDAASAY